jgi:hypothetical protein
MFAKTVITLEKLIEQISNKNPNIICGIEIMWGLRNSIELEDDFLNLDLQRIKTLVTHIAEQTDYQIVIRDKSIFICPQNNTSKNNMPLSLRNVHFPTSKQTNLNDFFALVRDENNERCLFFNIVLPGFVPRIDNFSIEGSQQIKAADIVSELARKVGAKRWQIFHIVSYENNELKTLPPYDLSMGFLTFH